MKINLNGISNPPVLNFRQNKVKFKFHADKKQLTDSFAYSMPETSYTLKNQTAKDRTALLRPIDKEEYNKLLHDIFRYMYFHDGNGRLFLSECCYESVDNDLKGLISYCGLADKSNAINSWLSGRSIDFYESITDEQMANVVNTLDYSLDRLDDKFGKFEGKVYRNGFFNPITDKQYYSSSDIFSCARGFSHHVDAVNYKPYSIIKVKNGHKIYDFQNLANTKCSLNFEKLEHEVLLDRKSKFRQIPPEEFTKEDIKDIKMILRKAYGYLPWQIDLDKMDSRFGLYSKITVWEEI